MPGFLELAAGEPMPTFTQRSATNPRYAIDTAAGRYLVLCFFHSAADPNAQAALQTVLSRPDLFDDGFASFFGISTDPADETRLANRLPGYRFIWDFDRAVAPRFGAIAVGGGDNPLRRALWVICDPTLRLIQIVPFAADGSDRARMIAVLDALPPPAEASGRPLQAPILYLPRVFGPDFCSRLIDLYNAQGGEVSGFMREVAGKTTGLHDKGHKVRRDVNIEDPGLKQELQRRIVRRVVPEIAKVHQYDVTRMERYLVACYDAVEGGHFAAHRDNTTAGTAHRRFAVSVNLNDDFDGGEVSFPEYGAQGFKAPPGGAVVFSCSLLHKVSQVTRGQRFAFLPFLYDDAAAKLRADNLQFLATEPNVAPQPR